MNLDSRYRGRGNADGNLGARESGGGYWQKSNSHPMMHQRQPQLGFDRGHHYHGSSPGNHRNAAAIHRHGMGEQQRMSPPAAVHNQRGAGPDVVPFKERRDGRHNNSNNNNPNVDRRESNHRQGNGGPSSLLKREFFGGQGSGSGDVWRPSQSSHRLDQPVSGGMGRNFGSGSSVEELDRGTILEESDGFGSGKSGSRDLDDLADQLEESLMLGEDTGTTENHVVKQSSSSRGKDVRIDLFRGQYVSSQRVRIRRRDLECRYDIDSLTPLFLAIYKSLTPADEEKGKQKQLLLSLEKLVNKEWPNAKLHLYGSCANSFGVSKSDIDICLAIDDTNMSKSEILLKLAEILESDNLQNVQALTHARVPIVKMMDPVTGISCDICINNLLAVANTKLLRDYAQIDDRLRQLAFIVKHWAKSRGVNETYRGTLSSYAYVLMCIHFLQQRKPAILPCLQDMEATYFVNVDGTQCAYFDQVDRLRCFGAQNNETIARLLWGFFHYWAYHHDYMNDVISVRTGRNISKRVKDWTRRIGNDRHLICIEDPFETSHDLGRVVDKFSIRILREEFERAADVLQYDSNPSVTLFEPYVPRSASNGLQSDQMGDGF